MKTISLAAIVLTVALAPLAAFAQGSSQIKAGPTVEDKTPGARQHGAVYHDRTPRPHVHSAQAHHQG